MKSRLCSSVSGATFKVLKRPGAISAIATISKVSSQYSGTTRTIRRRQNSTGPIALSRGRDDHDEATDHEEQVDAGRAEGPWNQGRHARHLTRRVVPDDHQGGDAAEILDRQDHLRPRRGPALGHRGNSAAARAGKRAGKTPHRRETLGHGEAPAPGDNPPEPSARPLSRSPYAAEIDRLDPGSADVRRGDRRRRRQAEQEVGERDHARDRGAQAVRRVDPAPGGRAGRQPADRRAAQEALQPVPVAVLRQQAGLPDHAVAWPTATTSAAGCRRTGPRSAIRRRASRSTASRTARWRPRSATSTCAA